jgi:transitional endoplasmic reticulum ATPase
VIGAKNRPDIIDEALLRPGRFDRILEVPFPDKKAREDILKIHTRRKPLDNTIDIFKLVELTNGFTGADIAATVNAAAMSAIKEHVATITETNSNQQEGQKTAAEMDEQVKGAKSQAGEHKEEKQGLKITMKHFETALQKIKKKTTAINNPSLV